MADIKNTVVVGLRLEDETQKGTQSARSQLKSLRDEMQALEQSGQKNTQRFRELQAQAGGLADQIGDTQAQIKAMASDTRTLDTLLGVGQGLAGAFAVAQGAAALFGDENEELQKAMLKVQAALAILNGVQAVANVLNKDSALMVNLNAAAQRVYALAVGTSTGALKAFRIALVSTGIGAFVVALGLAADAMGLFSSKTEDEVDNQKDIKRALDETVGTLEFYERKLKAFGATDEQLAAIRIKRYELERENIQKNLDDAIKAEGKKHNEYQNAARQEIEVLKVKIREEQNIIDKGIADRQAAEAAARAKRLEERKREFEQQKKDNEVDYMQSIDGFQKYMDKLVSISTLGEMQIRGGRRYGIKEMLADEKAFNDARVSMYSIAAGSIVEIMRSLGGKSKGVMLAALALEKAAAIAQVLVNLQKEKSAIAANVPNTVASPDFGLAAKSAMMKLATISAGFRIAAIAATGFSQARGITGGGGDISAGGGGGGASLPAPTATNPNSQLLNPPANGQGQGMRAYVVESDIRSVSGRLRRMSEFATLGA